MNPVKASLNYPQVTLLLTAAVVAAGVYSLATMPRREDPKITIRTGLVVAVYPGATAEQVEKQVTRKIEDRLFRLAEVRKGKTWSVSRNNLCVINVELEDNIKQPDLFWSKLRHALIELKLTELPDSVQGPTVRDDFGDTVATLLALHGGNYSYDDLKEYARRIEDEFRTTRAVAKLQRIGEQKEEIRITSSMERVAQYSLSPLKVIQALKGRNSVQYGGELKTASGEVSLKPSGLFQSEEEIRRMMIDMSPTGQPVYLGDLAKVERVEGEPRTLCRFNGDRAVLVSVEMLEGNNIVDFGHELKAKLERTRAGLPPDLQVDVIADQPAVVEDRISHFIREFGIAIASVILVTVLLLPFRVALIASLAIPVTVAATFALMHAIGVELHQVSISALIVVLGMVVDDAIVIADNYVELLDRNTPRNEAAWRCATELVVPVLTATATIIAAFLPMLMITGSVGEFIQALPIAVTVALSCSFVVAMLLTPWLCRFFIQRGLKAEAAEGAPKKFSVLDLMQRSYSAGIQVAMRQKTLTLAGGLAAFVIAMVLLGKAVPERFFPTAERAQFVVHIWMKEGARLDATNAAARKVESFLKSQPLVVNYSTFVGESAPRFYYNVDPEFPAKNYAQLLVNTRSAEATPELVFRLRQSLSEVVPEAFTMVRELEQGTRMHAPIEVRIVSTHDGPDDLVRLKSMAAQVREVLRDAPGAEYTFHDFHEDIFDMGVRVDEEVANRLGLSNQSIALQLSGGFSGLPVSTFWEGDRDVPVVLRLDEQYRRSFEDVNDAYVVSSLTGARVPLRTVARLSPEWRSGRILHRNGVRTLTVMALAHDGVLPSNVLKAALPGLQALQLPDGYRLEYGGEVEGQRDTFSEMKVVMLLSIVAIFLILLFQFRSPVQTLVIMASIPLAMPGAVLGLLVTGNPFSFTAFMGVISLSGVVVRNAIILVEYINERRHAGVSLEAAALEAGERRLRPIFLTTAAAAVGVTPMILSGSSLWSPLASVIAVGLICSMFFTLVVVPVLYVVCESRAARRAPALAGLALLLLAGSARAETRRITLDEAVSLARQQNAVVKLARLKVKESQSRQAAVRANYFPQVTNESNVLYNSGLENLALPRGFLGVFPQLGPLPAEDMRLFQGDNTFGAIITTVGQPVTQLIKIREGTRVARQDVGIAKYDTLRAENEIALKTREAYLGALILDARIGAARRKLDAADEATRESRDAVASGAALEVKALESEARRLEQGNAVLAAELQLADVKTELNDLLGLPLDTTLELVAPTPAALPPAPLPALVEEACAHNPEVKAAEMTVEKARHGVAAAKAEFIPDVSLFALYGFQNGMPFVPTNNGVIGAKMSWNVFDWGKRSAVVSERQSLEEQARENLRRVRNRVAIDVEKSRRKVERLDDLVRVAEKAVAVRREARRIGANQTELGLATAIALKQTEAALAEAEAQLLEARLGLSLAQAELERTLGR